MDSKKYQKDLRSSAKHYLQCLRDFHIWIKKEEEEHLRSLPTEAAMEAYYLRIVNERL